MTYQASAVRHADTDAATRLALDVLDHLATTLRTRYDHECSYRWADTAAFREGTGKLERDACALVRRLFPKAEIELQGDPRGAPIQVRIDGREFHFG